MMYITERDLTRSLRTNLPPDQPGAQSLLTISVAEWQDSFEKTPGPELARLHEDSFIDFVYPEGFGYIKDRQHVAGFQSHRFSAVPKPSAEQWAVRSIELIGLVLHDEAVAYVAKRLPKMDELREAPTRPLDAFETMGLAALSRGEDMFCYEDANGLRLLGALRSTKQCLDCHGGKRGDLLGAFSYTLHPAKDAPAPR